MSKRTLLRWMGAVAMLGGAVLWSVGWAVAWTKLRYPGLVLMAMGGIWLVISLFASREPMRAVQQRYVREILLSGVAYLLVVFALLPLVKGVDALWLKALIALLPVLPTVFMVRPLVRKVLDSDELQQRIQLEAISIASLSVGMLSMAVGFLGAAHVLPTGNLMLMVLPALFVFYGIALAWVRRRYSGE